MSSANSSFFGRFRKRMLDETGDDPGGRYFSILLEAAFNEEPGVVGKALFPSTPSNRFLSARASTEEHYRSRRYADLAVFSASGDVIGIVEVKEDDQLTKRNADQLRDYLSFSAERNVPFTYLTQHMPSLACGELLKAHAKSPMYYSDLYRALAALTVKQSSPVVRFLLDYLLEFGPVYEPLNEADNPALRLLLRQAFSLVGRIGFGKEKTPEKVLMSARILGRLISNAESLGIDFRRSFRSHFGVRFATGYSFQPNWNIEKLKADITKNGDDYEEIDLFDPTFCDGGTLHVWTEGKLKNTKCYVWLGHAITLSKSKKKMRFHNYAGVGKGGADHYESLSSPRKTFPSEQAAQKAIRKLLAQQIPLAIADNHSGSDGLKKLLKDL